MDVVMLSDTAPGRVARWMSQSLVAGVYVGIREATEILSRWII